jgi:protease I
MQMQEKKCLSNSAQLNEVVIAILTADGFEKEELTVAQQILDSEAAATIVVSPNDYKAKAWEKNRWGGEIDVDVPLWNARADDYDALLLLGGAVNIEILQADPQSLRFIRHFFDVKKPVAAICQAPLLLIEVGVARGRKLTSCDSIRANLQNAGAEWIDQDVVVDRGVITVRHASALPHLKSNMIQEFSKLKRRQPALTQ